MKVFISWSGEPSKQFAKALYDFIPMVLQRCKPWMSEDSIETGKRWSPELSRELNEAEFGIVCVTPNNLDSKWLMFEAGALSKSVSEARLLPLLFNLKASDLTEPLSQFQAAVFEKEAMFRTMLSINNNHNEPISKDQLKKTFDKFWPDLDLATQLEELMDVINQPEKRRPQDEILEELVQRIRNMENTLTGTNADIRSAPFHGRPDFLLYGYEAKMTHEIYQSNPSLDNLRSMKKELIALGTILPEPYGSESHELATQINTFLAGKENKLSSYRTKTQRKLDMAAKSIRRSDESKNIINDTE